MKALTFNGKQQINFETVDDPSILSPTDAIVKVKLCAICGSDLHVYREHEKGLDHGTVMGHEFVGEIVETGKAVTNLQKGDKVVSPFSTNCGHCYYCQIGLTCRCEHSQLYGWVEHGQGLHGTQAEYVRVPLAEGSLMKYDSSISDAAALFTGDIMATGYHCAAMAEIKEDGTYVVMGCGPVGLMAILGAFDQGAKEVFAIDAVAERLDQAKAYGAIPINFQKEEVVAILQKATKGRGVDAVMDAVGSDDAARLAYELIRAGGIISTVGVHNSDHMAFNPVEAYNKNLTYKIGRCPARHYMPMLLDKLQKGKMDTSAIITHRLPLSAGPQAYEMFDQKKDGCLKILLAD